MCVILLKKKVNIVIMKSPHRDDLMILYPQPVEIMKC